MINLSYQLLRLARPKQWAKNVFVLLGPLYAMRDRTGMGWGSVRTALLAAVAFSLASSAVYVINDILDIEKDRNHPRKCKRPLASGQVRKGQAWVFAVVLAACALASCGLVEWVNGGEVSGGPLPLMLTVGLYVLNVCLYSAVLKHLVVMDVLSLSLGFVLRVLGGCVALAVSPSTWLLNVTLFLAMFLAFGKRLGERRTLGEGAAGARGVHVIYTDDILRMFVVVTAVATLITYAFYVQSRDLSFKVALPGFPEGVNVLWLTMLPAVYALARAIVLLERGVFDDPTELASKDWPMQLSVLVFVAFSLTASRAAVTLPHVEGGRGTKHEQPAPSLPRPDDTQRPNPLSQPAP